jgi:hypothetical protein
MYASPYFLFSKKIFSPILSIVHVPLELGAPEGCPLSISGLPQPFQQVAQTVVLNAIAQLRTEFVADCFGLDFQMLAPGVDFKALFANLSF